ncbi:MAG: SMP-30/gluconolactonase/LRE family protein [Tannerella sp.]|jgi:sugar lactone lactonase YvrE|nr:SMP-30/gluconolactonase/LRE family protein [Tannerella sp.]
MKNGTVIIMTLILFSGITYAAAGQERQQNGYASVYTGKPEDSLAVYFTPEEFDIKNDGSQDISEALQSAIDKVQETVRYGVVFIPEGTYRISKTIYVWKGIRLIGYGKKRPVFLLGRNTEGFQAGAGKYMFHFCLDKPWGNRPVQDANAGTFYSGMRNVDIRIEGGNPAAVAVRFHVAQHSFLSHMDFYLNPGNVGIEDGGNEIEYCRFFGGDYAIRTGKTAPGWQFLILDTYFEGQKQSAVQTREAGLTIVRAHFRKSPSAVIISEGYPEELWISDSRFEDIRNHALLISNENNPRTEINAENIVCIRTPEFAVFRTSGQTVKAPYKYYVVKEFTHGLQISDLGGDATVRTIVDMEPLENIPPPVASDVPLLPPVTAWVNLKSLGAKGDGTTDDTHVLRQAIENHAVIYLPGGHYRVTEPIVLKSHTILAGLHPSLTQIMLKDSTPAYQGAGPPLPLLETPQGGTNIVTGIGLNTAGVNARAVAVKWMAGEQSMLNDVRFAGGHGTYTADGKAVPVYNDNRTADGIPFRKWDSQYWSLWITDGGGGTFKDIWTPSPYAAAGMYISHTATKGRVYYMSSEHHVRNEIILHDVSNWRFMALQLEEESGEGPYCLPLDIRNSSRLLFANTFLYRVSRITTPFPYAIRVENVSDIRFKGLHNYSWTKHAFDNTVYDVGYDCYVRPREIARLDISGKKPPVKNESRNHMIAVGEVMKLAGGFEFIDAATADRRGNIYFTDSKAHRIYCWSVDDKLSLIWDLPMNPVSLAFDKSGRLMVVTRTIQTPSIHTRGEIGVVSFDPEHPETTMETLEEIDFNKIPKDAAVYYQTTRHQHENNLPEILTAQVKTCFIARDGSAVIPNTNDIGQTCSLKAAVPGKYFYASTSPGLRTYRCLVSTANTLTSPELFAETGAVDVAEDANGNIYIPSDHIKVFDSAGALIGEIETPERPLSLLFGGKDGRTLFICTASSLYSVRIKQ